MGKRKSEKKYIAKAQIPLDLGDGDVIDPKAMEEAFKESSQLIVHKNFDHANPIGRVLKTEVVETPEGKVSYVTVEFTKQGYKQVKAWIDAPHFPRLRAGGFITKKKGNVIEGIELTSISLVTESNEGQGE